MVIAKCGQLCVCGRFHLVFQTLVVHHLPSNGVIAWGYLVTWWWWYTCTTCFPILSYFFLSQHHFSPVGWGGEGGGYEKIVSHLSLNPGYERRTLEIPCNFHFKGGTPSFLFLKPNILTTSSVVSVFGKVVQITWKGVGCGQFSKVVENNNC